MIKKILIGFILLVMVLIVAVSIFSKKAPDILRAHIERALNKKVIIENIEYRFPNEFELQGVAVKEKGEPFDGETSFHADRVFLQVSPLAFSQNALIIDKIKVENATIVIRKLSGDLHQALSGVMAPVSGSHTSTQTVSAEEGYVKGVPLTIHELELKDSFFEYIDYDATPTGFVILFSKINSQIKRIKFPSSTAKTSYHVTADLEQGRGERSAKTEVSGQTVFATLETDASFLIKNVYLPYFQPYYSQVTGAVLEDGFADLRAIIKIQDHAMDMNVGLELSGLNFTKYEGGGQLFGLKADEILSFLKDSSGRLKFQIMAQWNILDKSVRLKEIFRMGIERSLRETVLGSVGNIIMKSIQQIGEGCGTSSDKEGIESKIKKIKDFFKY